MKLTCIGNVNSKFDRYKKIIAKYPNTIQVGDMGVGFRKTQGIRAGEFTQNPPHYAMLAGNQRFIRGNHDNPGVCKRHSQWISDGTIENGAMFVGGALSIDKMYRQEGYNWWPDEELSQKELWDMTEVYCFEKPRIMITHDCPSEVGKILLAESEGFFNKLLSRTCQAFQSMWSTHSPELWVFGHWRYSFDRVLNSTRFICLNKLEIKEFKI